MHNHNKAQQSKNRVHIPWDILYLCEKCCLVFKFNWHFVDLIDSKEIVFVQMMSWHQSGVKTVYEPMMSWSDDEYMHGTPSVN